jgi:hypothetical protein
MTSMRSFFSGFILGFGSGIAFRALAENDFEPIKDAAKTAVSGLQKVGDSLNDTFGRMREAFDDVRAQARAERIRAPASSTRVVKPATRTKRTIRPMKPARTGSSKRNMAQQRAQA